MHTVDDASHDLATPYFSLALLRLDRAGCGTTNTSSVFGVS